MTPTTTPSTSFSEFGLLATLQKTLKEKNLRKPTEIQTRIIPLMLAEKSVVGISETGSGKTLSYVLPILHVLKALEAQGDEVKKEGTPRAVVMVPTRELGEQISKVFKEFTHDTRLRVRPALGGTPTTVSKKNVSGPFEVLLATPGRLSQLLADKSVWLDDVRILIFDEVDQMMDEGFKADSNRIAEACPDELTLGLFSATVSPEVEELMENLFAKANVIYSSGSGKLVKTLTTKNLKVEDGKRWPLLIKTLEEPMEGGTLLFTNTREQCDTVAEELTKAGYVCGVYRGDMDSVERKKTLQSFRNGNLDLLISTDLAGRGLDVELIDRVINYHLPQEIDNYIHRVGRTARAGRKGLVVNLVTERDLPLINEVEKLK